MPTDISASIVSKVRNYAHVLKNAGIGYGDYVEQITYLLFGFSLRLPGFAQPCGIACVRFAPILKLDPPSPRLRRAATPIPDAWSELSSKSGDDLEPSGARWTIRKDRPQGWLGVGAGAPIKSTTATPSGTSARHPVSGETGLALLAESMTVPKNTFVPDARQEAHS